MIGRNSGKLLFGLSLAGLLTAGYAILDRPVREIHGIVTLKHLGIQDYKCGSDTSNIFLVYENNSRRTWLATVDASEYSCSQMKELEKNAPLGSEVVIKNKTIAREGSTQAYELEGNPECIGQ